MKSLFTLSAVCTWLSVSATLSGSELGDPVPLRAGGAQIDVEHSGHAAPCVADFDGDGVKDLLVGEMFQGRLRIYRNLGSNAEPRFGEFSILLDGTSGGRVPAG